MNDTITGLTASIIFLMQTYKTIDDCFSKYGIELCGVPSEIHIYKGIDKLAEVLGCELTHGEHDDEYDRMSFEYDGNTFFQLKRKPVRKLVMTYIENETEADRIACEEAHRDDIENEWRG